MTSWLKLPKEEKKGQRQQGPASVVIIRSAYHLRPAVVIVNHRKQLLRTTLGLVFNKKRYKRACATTNKNDNI